MSNAIVAQGSVRNFVAAAQGAVLRGLVPAVARLPKDDRLVLFGAMNGTWYGDNSRHLYEWVLAHRPDVRAVWMTRDQEVHRRRRAEGRPVALSSSPRGIRLLWRARAAAFSNSLRDIAPDPALAPRSLRLLALRHGRSVKRVRFARLGHQISAEEARARRQEGDMIDYAISTSEFISDLQEECLRIGRAKHVVTGYPRNDALFEVSPRQRQD